MRPTFKRPSKASGSQIGKKTVKIKACPSCLTNDSLDEKTCAACGEKIVSFDSRGEFRKWCELTQLSKLNIISDLARQVRMPLYAYGGKKVGELVLDFVFSESGETVYADYKGGAMTELAAWKMRHFEAQYGQAVRIITR